VRAFIPAFCFAYRTLYSAGAAYAPLYRIPHLSAQQRCPNASAIQFPFLFAFSQTFARARHRPTRMTWAGAGHPAGLGMVHYAFIFCAGCRQTRHFTPHPVVHLPAHTLGWSRRIRACLQPTTPYRAALPGRRATSGRGRLTPTTRQHAPSLLSHIHALPFPAMPAGPCCVALPTTSRTHAAAHPPRYTYLRACYRCAAACAEHLPRCLSFPPTLLPAPLQPRTDGRTKGGLFDAGACAGRFN